MNSRTSLPAPTAAELRVMEVVRDHVATGALSMIDWADHKPANRGKKPKVGGHQASNAIDALHGMRVDDLVQAAVADVRWRRRLGL